MPSAYPDPSLITHSLIHRYMMSNNAVLVALPTRLCSTILSLPATSIVSLRYNHFWYAIIMDSSFPSTELGEAFLGSPSSLLVWTGSAGHASVQARTPCIQHQHSSFTKNQISLERRLLSRSICFLRSLDDLCILRVPLNTLSSRVPTARI